MKLIVLSCVALVVGSVVVGCHGQDIPDAAITKDTGAPDTTTAPSKHEGGEASMNAKDATPGPGSANFGDKAP